MSQVSRDTSYTVSSAFDKINKEYPYARIVGPISTSRVSVIEDLEFKKVGGRQLRLDVYYYNQVRRNPTIILIHGGGWKSGNKDHMKPLAMRLASEGFTCVNVEYRLSPEALFPAGIMDVLGAITYLKREHDNCHVDKDKIAVLGCSSGAQMASLIGTLNGSDEFGKLDTDRQLVNDVSAVINMDGVLAFKHPESREGDVAAQWLGGTYDQVPEIWRQASALHNVDINSPPVLFINSQYPRFHAGRDDMIAKMDSLGIYTEVRNIKNSPHTFWLFDPWFDDIIVSISKFLEKAFN